MFPFNRNSHITVTVVHQFGTTLRIQANLDSTTAAALARIEANQHTIIQQQEKLMALTQADFDAVLAKLDAASTKAGQAATAIQTRIDNLETAIHNAGLSADQEQALLSHLSGVSDNLGTLADSLTQLGTEPTNPVPVEPPPPVEVPPAS